MHPLVNEFMAVFDGFRGAYGTYKITTANQERREDGKIKGVAASVSGEVNIQLWDKHLLGTQGLGIIPINADSMSKFGAIDVDEYPLDMVALCKNIHDNKLPLVPCRTKSGGAHLYLFLTDFVEARVIIAKLREMASYLGYGNCEIYPRQTQLLVERGDAGNWINMPYFNEVKTDRYGLNAIGDPIKRASDFLKGLYSKTITPEQLSELHFRLPEILPGGPPCLQQLVTQGFPKGTRNNGLFNLGVYSMMAYPDDWERRVDEYNVKYMSPPLSPTETLGVIKSVKKKEYGYTCKAQPIQSFCNAAVCRTCKFGVGGADLGMPKMGTLTKLKTVPPIWFLDVETEAGGGRLELSTEDLQHPLRFQNRCMISLNIMPAVLKRDNWQEIIRKLLMQVNEIEVPVEATPRGQMLQHLESFCTSRAQAKICDDLLRGLPWLSNGEYHFRFTDYQTYLDRANFNLLTLPQIHMYLREALGYRKHFHNIKGKGVNVVCVSVKMFTRQAEGFKTPEQPRDVM